MYERSNILQFRPEQTTALDAFSKAQGAFQGISKENAAIDLARAQAEHVQQQVPVSPMQRISEFQEIMKRFPPGSPQFMYADRGMAGIMAQANTGDWVPQMKGGHGGMGSLGGGLGAGSMGGGSSSGIGGSEEGGLDVDQSSTFRNRGLHYTQTNPNNGDITSYTSLTTPVTSQIETRTLAGIESKVLQPFINKGFSSYNSIGGGAEMLNDSLTYRNSKNPEKRNAARNRLLNYAAAYRLERENAINRLKQGGQTQIGEEAVTSMMKQLNPNLPSAIWLKSIPRDINNEASILSGMELDKASKTAQIEGARGLPLDLGKNAPASISPGFGSAAPNTWTGIEAQLQNQQKQQMQDSGIGAAPKTKKESSGVGAKKENANSLDAQAAAAIKAGADPKAVYARLAELNKGKANG